MACVGTCRAKEVLLRLGCKEPQFFILNLLLSSGDKPVSRIQQLYMTTKQVSNDVHVHPLIKADHTHTLLHHDAVLAQHTGSQHSCRYTIASLFTSVGYHDNRVVDTQTVEVERLKTQKKHTYFTFCLLPTQITAG